MRTSTAVSQSAWRTCPGLASFLAPRTTAAAPAAWGAAADVPENRAQPSDGAVPSGGSPSPVAPRSVSIGQPGGIGSMMYEARGRIPTRPETVGTVTPSNQGLSYALA